MAERTITVSTLAGDEKRTVNDADTSLIERLDLIPPLLFFLQIGRAHV